MNHLISTAMFVAWTAPVWATAAEPLAQDFVVVYQARNLDDPKKAECVGTPDILQLPTGRLIASMELWLKRPTSGDEGGIDYPNHCKIKTSDDGGRTWRQISTNGITWGSLFYVKEALHMIGNDPHKRDIRIIRSADDGRTWSKPVTLFDDSRYHGAATPVHVKDGFVYRAFEDMNRGSASLVVAGDTALFVRAMALCHLQRDRTLFTRYVNNYDFAKSEAQRLAAQK